MSADTPEAHSDANESSSSKKDITDSVFSFDDGDVYLLSCPTAKGQRVRYKVHRNILSAFSGTFNDMFSMPTPSSGASPSSHSEIPSIQLDEEQEIIRAVLSFIYANRGIDQHNIREHSTENLLKTALFCDKYHIASLQNAVENFLLEYLDRHKEYEHATGEYDVDFDARKIITLFGYAHNTNNTTLKVLAADAITKYLTHEEQTFMDLDEEDTDSLSGPALRELWTTQYERLLRSSTEENANLEKLVGELKRQARTVHFLLQLPEVGMKHSTELCFQRDVVPVWSRIVRNVLAGYRGQGVPAQPSVKNVVRDLKEGAYGTCKICTEAIEKRYSEILGWK